MNIIYEILTKKITQIKINTKKNLQYFHKHWRFFLFYAFLM